ncbi:2TM domain-containing protein [Flavobacterium hercynium]|jgi:hypothetical protein|uniref:2TM domain-containing protein n=1 Tax=Flavobacterium hercynium TaxID=387094 RepID=A0A226HFP4_9FLAO|nr:2TM domain-containing protein [Flavobacterium hercynium]OXA93097.1 hypothetical protein B0A66_07420 [Flavobacterium hercynium]PAM96591.1 hypothetical protein B4N84_01105 [Flavobacterium sp. IR1]SMP32468.1 2TM domain-containing protein [Flavobacterium hercynium]
MGQFRRRMYNEYSQEFSNDENFNIAYQKVRRIRKFYSHLRIYLIVNFIIIIANLNKDFFGHGIQESGLLNWETYSTALFWGIGLLAHALSVFGRDILFSDEWEKKKIQEYMSKESANNKWE